MHDIQSIVAAIKSLPGDAKANIRRIVAEAWPSLPSYSTLPAALVEEVQKATAGAGVVMVFKERGERKAVMVKVGTHYQSPQYAADPAMPTYMIPGGFINLTETPGTALIPPNPDKAEAPQVGAIRELEEEVVDDQGKPIITARPERLKPMDTKTLQFPTGEKRLVTGFMLELTPQEVVKIKAHVARLEQDETYRHAVRAHTTNPGSNKPEICSIAILPLKALVEGKYTLLHPEQKSLFENIQAAYSKQVLAA